MKSQFTARLTALITDTPLQPLERLAFVRNAFEDTLAVAYAGWGEAVTRRVASPYPQGEALRPDSTAVAGTETAALILGTASHALDYDDVHQSSNTHPSAPIVAGLVAAAQAEPALRERVGTAFAVGLAANVAIGQVLGFAHYEKGWHATSTIGPVATAAALAYLYALPADAAAHALAIAAAQAGGLQRNFGAMAKPLQAGLAGAAGVRAAQMARAGVTADDDVFAPKGYFDLYRGAELEADPEQVPFDLFGGGISVKLYPCCYQTHRLIAASLAARETLVRGGVDPQAVAEIDVQAPAGSTIALRVLDPQVGSEGKFCGVYTIAAAMVDGEVGLRHFDDDAVHRKDIRDQMRRTRLAETQGKPDGVGRRSKPVHLYARDAEGRELAQAEVQPFPGSPDAPPTEQQIRAKVQDCLAYYERHTGQACSYEQFQAFVDGLLAPGLSQPLAAAGDD